MTFSPSTRHLAVVSAKFGLAALVAAEAARWLVPDDRLSAAFVALICCQPSLTGGLRRGGEQLLASVLGVGCALTFLALLPEQRWTIGCSAAVAYAVAGRLRWPYPTVIVALFSALYMHLYLVGTIWNSALLRCESVLLGVIVGMVINWLFSPLTHRANVSVRIGDSLALVREQIDGLAVAVASGATSAVDQRLALFGDVFRQLGGLQGDLSELREDFHLQHRPGGLHVEAVYLGDRSLAELEQILHHAWDVGTASARLQAQPPDDAPLLLALAKESLARASEGLTLAGAGRHHEALALAQGELARIQELDRQVAPPSDVTRRLGPRLVLLVGLAQLHSHLEQWSAVALRTQTLNATLVSP